MSVERKPRGGGGRGSPGVGHRWPVPHPGTAGPRGWGFTPSIGSSPGDGKPRGVGRSPVGLRRTRMGDEGSGRGPRGLAGGHLVTGLARARGTNGGLKVRSLVYSSKIVEIRFTQSWNSRPFRRSRSTELRRKSTILRSPGGWGAHPPAAPPPPGGGTPQGGLPFHSHRRGG